MSEDISRVVARRILSLKKPRETWSAFAERIGLTPQVVSNYEKGNNGASVEAAATVAAKLKVSGHWLLTGDGPKLALRPGLEQEGFRAIAEIADRVRAGGPVALESAERERSWLGTVGSIRGLAITKEVASQHGTDQTHAAVGAARYLLEESGLSEKAIAAKWEEVLCQVEAFVGDAFDREAVPTWTDEQLRRIRQQPWDFLPWTFEKETDEAEEDEVG